MTQVVIGILIGAVVAAVGTLVNYLLGLREIGNGGIARMSVGANGGTERTNSAARSGITSTNFETTRNDVVLTRS